MSELVVRISADIKKLQDGYKVAAQETEDLNDKLSSIAKTSGVAFAALSGAIGVSIAAYREQEKQERKIQALIESTGGAAGLTAEEIKKMASALQDVTTVGDEAILQGQAILLTFTNIGKDVFPQVTEAALNVAEIMGTDMKSAATQLGKALNDPVQGISALTRVGIQFTDQQKAQIKALQESGNLLGAQKIILSELDRQFGGTARSVANGTGVFIQLKNTFGDVLEEIGKRFLPVIGAGAKAINEFLKSFLKNEGLVTLTVSLLGIGTALTGLVAATATAGVAFLKYRAIVAALQATNSTFLVNILTMGGMLNKLPIAIGTAITAFKGLSLAMKILVGSTGIGLLVVALSTLLFSWEATWNGIKKITFATIDAVKGVLSGFADVMIGVFTFDTDRISKGWDQIKAASVKGASETIDAVKEVAKGREGDLEISPKAGETKTPGDNGEADQTQIMDAETKKRLQIAKDEIAVLKAKRAEASNEEIDFLKRSQELKRQQAEADAIENQDLRAAELERIRLSREELLKEQDEYAQKKREEELRIREEDLAFQEELRALDKEQRAALTEEDLTELRNRVQTEKEVENEIAREKLTKQIDLNNQRLKDQKKFGTAYAEINRFLNTEEVQGAQNAANQLVALTNSKNNTLKGIGKAAALAQLAIQTAQGAISAYASLAPIPLVGPALGAAAAAALVAYGFERKREILAANTGGLVTGGIPGKDSVPSLLTPGELVVPEKNFEEVVAGVQATRSGTGGESNRDLLQEISNKLDNVHSGSQTIINGDVLSDEVFIDRLVDKINDGIQFRNLQLRT